MPEESSRNVRHFLSIDEEHKAENPGKECLEEAKEERGVPRRKHLINEDTLVCMNHHDLFGS